MENNASSKNMGALEMHGWMACLQQIALAPGLGQQILHLAQPPLDDLLYYTYIQEKNMENIQPSITKQWHLNNIQVLVV